MWTFALSVIGLAGLGIAIYMLMRLEEMLGHLNSHAFRSFSSFSAASPVFSPLQLYLQLTRAQAAQALYASADADFMKRREEKKEPERPNEWRDLLGVAYDREVEAWRYSLMVEANLQVALGKLSRDEGLKWVREQEPNMFARLERIKWGVQDRAAKVRGERPSDSRISPPWESHSFRYAGTSPQEFNRAAGAAWSVYWEPPRRR
jgi:hypothetical protein